MAFFLLTRVLPVSTYMGVTSQYHKLPGSTRPQRVAIEPTPLLPAPHHKERSMKTLITALAVLTLVAVQASAAQPAPRHAPANAAPAQTETYPPYPPTDSH